MEFEKYKLLDKLRIQTESDCRKRKVVCKCGFLSRHSLFLWSNDNPLQCKRCEKWHKWSYKVCIYELNINLVKNTNLEIKI